MRAMGCRGRLPETYSHLPFERRLVEVYRAGLDYAQAMDIALPNAKVYADTPINLGPAVFDLLRSPRLLSAVESLIGGEIYSNPIQHVRIKAPRKYVEAQDKYNALLDKPCGTRMSAWGLEEADDTQLVTAWVAVTEATAENGCLQLVPKSHRQGLALHCTPGRSAYPNSSLNWMKPCPCRLARRRALLPSLMPTRLAGQPQR